jgi:hypothetical protein
MGCTTLTCGTSGRCRRRHHGKPKAQHGKNLGQKEDRNSRVKEEKERIVNSSSVEQE